MDLKTVLEFLINEFNARKVQYALIGGFAMGALGISRSTIDLDFLIDTKDINKVDSIMAKFGYRKIYGSKHVSQYYSDIKLFGEVDFLHATKSISKDMLKNAKTIHVFEGQVEIKVLRPEDIIGLKIQSIANNPDRYLKEMADIEEIIRSFETDIKWNILMKYFRLFKMDRKYQELKMKYEKTQK